MVRRHHRELDTARSESRDGYAGAFSANQAGNANVNIAVPTKTSQLTNDSDFITSDAVPRFATDGEIDALATDFNTLWGA